MGVENTGGSDSRTCRLAEEPRTRSSRLQDDDGIPKEETLVSSRRCAVRRFRCRRTLPKVSSDAGAPTKRG